MIKLRGRVIVSGLAIIISIAMCLVVASEWNEAKRSIERQIVINDCHNAMSYLRLYFDRHGLRPQLHLGESPCGDPLGWQIELAATFEPMGGPASDILASIGSKQQIDCQHFSDLIARATKRVRIPDGRKNYIGVWPSIDAAAKNQNRLLLIGSKSFRSSWYLADDVDQFNQLMDGAEIGEFSPDGIAVVFADGEIWWLSEHTPTKLLGGHTGAEESLPSRDVTLSSYRIDTL